jgi:hypothetical protein
MDEYPLLKRLRTMSAIGWHPIGDEAADRIEELETALKFYECGCKQDSCTPEEPKFRSIKCGWIAKAALKEKKDAD